MAYLYVVGSSESVEAVVLLLLFRRWRLRGSVASRMVDRPPSSSSARRGRGTVPLEDRGGGGELSRGPCAEGATSAATGTPPAELLPVPVLAAANTLDKGRWIWPGPGRNI